MMDWQLFTDNYIRDFSTATRKVKSNYCSSKIKTLKTIEGKAKYTCELYTTYLQCIENFCIFCLVLFDEKGVENIFDRKIHTKIKEQFDLFSKDEIKSRKSENKSFNETEFKILRWRNIDKIFSYLQGRNNGDIYRKNNEGYLNRILDDYKEDREFLNSFKHGFRIKSGGETETSFGMNGKCFAQFKYDSSLIYYTRENNKIYKNRIDFNYDRVQIHIELLSNIMDSLKKWYLSDGNCKYLRLFTINDQNSILMNIGRWKEQLF